MKHIIANWKAQKNQAETNEWIENLKSHDLSILEGSVNLVICPPFPHLTTLKQAFEGFANIYIGSQDVSAHGLGTFNGEVPAEVLEDIVTYSIVGHSERRNMYGENDEVVNKKALLASQRGIMPVVCVQGPGQTVPTIECLVAFEPSDSISTGDGQGDTADINDILAPKVSYSESNIKGYLYGGSVNLENISSILHHPDIDGVIVGGYSLDANDFYQLLVRATSPAQSQ